MVTAQRVFRDGAWTKPSKPWDVWDTWQHHCGCGVCVCVCETLGVTGTSFEFVLASWRLVVPHIDVWVFCF